jgi:capsular polysaccharide export protein
MLEAARDENPGARILIRTHPDVALGRRRGHFGPGDARGGVGFLAPDHPPAALFARAARVYCVTSQLGFEAILHGHRPRLFGLPFYAGWGLAEEEVACPRRSRARTAAELFAAAMLAAPVWYDPFADALTGFATAAVQMAERAAAWRENAVPTIATGMRLWKRPAVRGFLAGPAPLAFEDRPARAVARARASGGRIIVWAGREGPALAAAAAAAGVPLLRMEDGFLRSVGLGARLVAPASLVLDDLGIYYDPARPSRLEALIAASAGLPEAALARAAALRAAIVAGGVGKYNVGKAAGFAVPSGRRVLLVPGQVEDDAGLLRAAGAVRTNAALLRAARDAAPDAFLIWKPHPDVEAGLRPGAVDAAGIADAVATDADAATLLALAHEVWTISSLMGFEALLRGLTVTCLGAPFYAGWGLTRDLGPVPSRRTARPPLDGLVHAALIAYPRYRDPVTGLACAPEIVVSRLAARDPRLGRAPSRIARLLAAGQERLGGAAWLWR